MMFYFHACVHITHVGVCGVCVRACGCVCVRECVCVCVQTSFTKQRLSAVQSEACSRHHGVHASGAGSRDGVPYQTSQCPLSQSSADHGQLPHGLLPSGHAGEAWIYRYVYCFVGRPVCVPLYLGDICL